MAVMKRKRGAEAEAHKTSKKPQLISPAALVRQPRDQDTAFVRGGADVLTPLENRQIRAQVDQEILFEQEGARKSKKRSATTDLAAGPLPHRNPAAKTHAKPNGLHRHEPPAAPAKTRAPHAKVEGLSYKRLVKGLGVLGRVCEINRDDLGLSLPNNLTGYVPISSVSNAARQKILESPNAPSEKPDANPEVPHDQLPDLDSLFSLGQYLRAAVISSPGVSNSSTPEKKHVELSLVPEDANAGFGRADLVVGSVLQAEVVSLEDHGLTMHLGLGDSSPTAFLPFSELGANEGAKPPAVGAVLLCMVVKVRSNGKVIEVTADPARMGDMTGKNFLRHAPTVGALLSGTAVEFVVSHVTDSTLTGEMMNMVAVTADIFHSGAALRGKPLSETVRKGDKVKGRVVCSANPSSPTKILVSLLDHLVHFTQSSGTPTVTRSWDDINAIVSTVQSSVSIDKVEPGLGVFLSLGDDLPRAFAHISRLSDARIETLSPADGAYSIGSQHRARVLGFNTLDGLYNLSLEPRILSKPFLSVGDIKVGSFLEGSIDKLDLDASGVRAIFMDLDEGVRGFVESIHVADAPLKHPERTLKEGKTVRGRVLTVDRQRRKVQLTLKKSLLDESIHILKSYKDTSVGTRALGTIVHVSDAGTLVQFFGGVRGFLPASHLAEGYIDGNGQQGHTGQTIRVTVLSVDPQQGRMTVSCHADGAPARKREALQQLQPGTAVKAIVNGKSDNSFMLTVKGSKIPAELSFAQLRDPEAKTEDAVAGIRIGQTISSTIVLGRDLKGLKAQLTCQPALIQAFESRKIPGSIADVKPGSEIVGFVKNFSSFGIFVEFADGLTGLLPKNHLGDEASSEAGFGFSVGQVINITVLGIDVVRSRFVLTKKTLFVQGQARKGSIMAVSSSTGKETQQMLHEFSLGMLTVARVVSVKQTQVNVELAGGAPGRIDASAAFDSFDDIREPKHPLRSFKRDQAIPVRILGVHDTRNHRFLPVTHRGGATVFELSAKSSDQTRPDVSVLSVDQIELDHVVTCFVNNIDDNWIWVSLSPSVSGRIRLLDASDDAETLMDVRKHIPLGSALRARVVNLDSANGKVELSGRNGTTRATLSLVDISTGDILPARVTKVTPKQVLVQLSDSVSAPIQLTDLDDDFSKAKPDSFTKNQIVRVCVTGIDAESQRLFLSSRLSRVLASDVPVRDREITACDQLRVGETVRGFIKLLTDKGLLVALATTVTAFVRISDLSDDYIKDWKSQFEAGQLVEGKILHVDSSVNQIRLSLKRSHVDAKYQAPLTYSDYIPGQIASGKVRKAESFGIFVVLDNSCNVSGLCHRSEISDERVDDARTLFTEGESVRVKILSVDVAKRRMTLGLKAAYFEAEEASGLTKESSYSPIGSNPKLDITDGTEEVQTAMGLGEDHRTTSLHPDFWPEDDQEQVLDVADFEWNPAPAPRTKNIPASAEVNEGHDKKKRKKQKSSDYEDQTANLDADGPQNEADYERLLMSQPNSSLLWLGYMALYLEREEIDKARGIADRATRTINNQSASFRQEVLDVWVAYLNLENTYGDVETLTRVFERACTFNDAQEVYEHLASIYIRSGQPAKADDLFQTMAKKFSSDIKVWLNYATFLYETLSAPERTIALFPRALQALPTHTHVEVTSKIAQLEFRSASGDIERGRTMFEGLIGTLPKRTDLWNIYIDQEMAAGSAEQVRNLFSRVTKSSSKPKQAKFFFQKWLDFEGKNGDAKRAEQVKAKAAEFVRGHEAKT